MLIKIIFQLALNTGAVYAAAELTPGVSINSIQTALITFLFLALINSILKPILKIITLPINIITLGIFGMFINFLLLYTTFYFIPGLETDSVTSIVLFSVILAIINWLTSLFFE